MEDTKTGRKQDLQKMQICRFCFNSDESQLSNIYQREQKSVPLPIQIMSCVQIEVFPNDGLPRAICNSCKHQTNQSYIFKSNCKKADDALKNFLQSGTLVQPELLKRKVLAAEKRSSSKTVSPVKDVKIVTKKMPDPNDAAEVKRMKLEDGTEVITLCISQSDDSISQDESSQDAPEGESPDDEISEKSLVEPSQEPVKVNTDIYSCEFCDKSFALEQLLDIHVTNYHRDRKFSCPACGKMFFTKYDMMKHIQTHDGNKPFNCSVCNKLFSREALLRRHEEIHNEADKYLCAECDKTFLTKEDLDNHMKRHEKHRPFACSICDKSFVFKQGLERHRNSVHSHDRPFKCNYCEASFFSKIRLARHITSHAGLRPYPCKVCGRTFLLSHHLTRHMRSHFETASKLDEVVGRHKCDICSMSFRRKDSLINHSVIHSMVNLRCVICNTSFDTAQMVKDHITSHLQGLPFPCEKCDYSFETEKQLVEHEIKHAEMEYEEQIEKEVISEVKKSRFKSSSEYQAPDDDEENENLLYEGEEEEHEYAEDEEEVEQVSSYEISDFNDPSNIKPCKNQTQNTIMLTASLRDAPPSGSFDSQKPRQYETVDGLKQFFKTEEDSEEEIDETSEVSREEQEGHAELENPGIRPIFRMEGTKMYQRKGPIQRKIPNVQPPPEHIHTASLEEITEPISIGDIAQNHFQKSESIKVGDKVFKSKKFIISKQEMKYMAKLGILELKNGHVIMKSPGQPALNAKITPVQQSDIEDLIYNQKKSQVKQYERRANDSSFSSGPAAVEHIIEDFN